MYNITMCIVHLRRNTYTLVYHY